MKVVYGVTCPFVGGDKSAVEARRLAWSWVEKFGIAEPGAASDPGEGSVDGELGHTVSWRLLADEASSVLRLVHQAPPNEGSATGWSTQVWISHEADRSCGTVRSGPENPPGVVTTLRYTPGVPGIVGTWINRLEVVRDRLRIGTSAGNYGQNDVPALLKLLLDDRRQLPIVAISTTRNDQWFRPLVDSHRVARDLAGNAHVVVVDRSASWGLTQTFGKELSVFDGAVRIWWPRMTTKDDPYRHPLYLPDRIATDSGRAELDMIRRVWRAAVDAVGIPAIEGRLLAARSRGQVEALRARAADAVEWGEVDAVLKANDELREANQELVGENEDLRDELQRTRASSDLDEDAPSEVDSVEEAVTKAATESGQVVFLPSAYSSARESQYPEPDQVLADLRALGRVAARWAAGELPAGFEAAFNEEAVRFQKDIGQTAETKYRADYELEYAGKKVMMGPHLRRGRGSPTEILRIYWYVDRDTQQLVVGHVGKKLRDKSNP